MKGYVEYTRLKQVYEAAIQVPQINDYVKDLYKDYIGNSHFQAAARLVRHHAEKYFLCLDSLNKILCTNYTPDQLNTLFKNKPLMIIKYDKDKMVKIRVYPKLVISSTVQRHIRSVTDITPYSVLNSFMENYLKEKSNPQKTEQWKQFKSYWKRIKSYEELSTSKFLYKYILGSLPLPPDHIIRDLASQFDEIYNPLVLKYADKPEDYVNMYAKGGAASCMVLSDHRPWKFLVERYKLCPTSFYGYTGFIRGVYATLNGKVVARTLIYKNKNGWYHGRVFASTPQIKDKFKLSLNENKINKSGIDGQGRSLVGIERHTFEIPGLLGDRLYLCPVPYMDNIRERIIVSFNNITKNFSFIVKPDKTEKPIGVLLDTVSQVGYITENGCTIKKCAYCNTTIILDTSRNYTLDSETIFCSMACVKNSGNIRVRFADGNFRVSAPSDEYIKNIDNLDFVYSTIHAAINYGLLPIASSLAEMKVLNEIQKYSELNSSYGFGQNFFFVQNKHGVRIGLKSGVSNSFASYATRKGWVSLDYQWIYEGTYDEEEDKINVNFYF